jgi:hypothetical protein
MVTLIVRELGEFPKPGFPLAIANPENPSLQLGELLLILP